MTTIKLKNTTTYNKIPLGTDLIPGEMAIDSSTGKLYTKKDDGTITQLNKKRYPDIPSWRRQVGTNYVNDQVGTGWPKFQTALNDQITKARNAGLPSCSNMTAGGTFTSAVNAYLGACLMTDGRVYISPYGSTTARIYNPITNTTITPTGTYTVHLNSSATLLPDGRVFMVPNGVSNGTGKIYNPFNDTLTNTVVFPGNSSYAGGIIMQNGKVFCVPFDSTSAMIYDPITNTVITAGGDYGSGLKFNGSVLLPDGRVFCVPYSMTTARIYNPITDTTTIPSGTYPGLAAFGTGVLLQDGRVYICPQQTSQARIYNYLTDTLTIPSGTFPGMAGLAASGSGILMNDGRVFMVPFQMGNPRIYDPFTDTLITLPWSLTSTNYALVVKLLDGRLYIPPRTTATTGILVNASNGIIADPQISLSPFYNKY